MANPLSFLPFPATCLGIANAPTRSSIHMLLHDSLTLSASSDADDKDLLIEYAVGGLVAIAYKHPSLLRLEPNLLRKKRDYLLIDPNRAVAICHAAGSLLLAVKGMATLPAALPSIRVTYASFFESAGEQPIVALHAVLEVLKEIRYRNLVRSKDAAAAIAIGNDAIAIAEAGTFGTKYSLGPDARDLAPSHIKYLFAVLANAGVPTTDAYLTSILTKAFTIETDARQGIRITGLCYKKETRDIARSVVKAYIALVDWQPSQALYRLKLVAQGKLAMLVDILSEFSGIEASDAISGSAASNGTAAEARSPRVMPEATPSNQGANQNNTNSNTPTMPKPQAKPQTTSNSFAVKQAQFFMANKRMPNEAEKLAIKASIAASISSVALPTAPVDISSLPDAPF